MVWKERGPRTEALGTSTFIRDSKSEEKPAKNEVASEVCREVRE